MFTVLLALSAVFAVVLYHAVYACIVLSFPIVMHCIIYLLHMHELTKSDRTNIPTEMTADQPR